MENGLDLTIRVARSYGNISAIYTHLSASFKEARKCLAAIYEPTVRRLIQEIPDGMRDELPIIGRTEKLIRDSLGT
jgi:hypothetical protein